MSGLSLTIAIAWSIFSIFIVISPIILGFATVPMLILDMFIFLIAQVLSVLWFIAFLMEVKK